MSTCTKGKTVVSLEIITHGSILSLHADTDGMTRLLIQRERLHIAAYSSFNQLQISFGSCARLPTFPIDVYLAENYVFTQYILLLVL